MKIHDKSSTSESYGAKFKPLDEKLLEKKVKNPREAQQSDEFVGQTGDNRSLAIFKQTNPLPAISEDVKPGEFKPKPKDWTVLCYFNGNCDLESDIESSMKSLEKVGSDDNINFVAQMAYRSEDGKAERILLKKPGWLGFKKNSEVLADLGKTNMAHPQTLKDFISWGMKKFPANHYAVIMSGHGYGFVGSMPDEVADDIMLTTELKSALDTATKETGEKIDILGFDSCLMANAETAYATKDSADFLVGSEEVLISGNWDYSEFGGKMKEEANGDGLTVFEALEAMVKSQQNYKLLTSSIIDCRDMPGFARRLKKFSEKLLNTETPDRYIKHAFRNAQHYCQPKIMAQAANGDIETKPMNQMRDVVSVTMEIIASDYIADTDLKQSALDLAKFIKDQVVVFEMHRKGMDISGSKGISIYTPTSDADKYADFYENKLSLGKDTGWGKVVRKFGVS
ncbi:MAG: hypothetical protein K8T10_19525 [Candidatus Eremiobacteraeota bacterium]|nr:hypothetical protein [Candidatus Eremiobacteraeota bacterium]